MLCIDELIEHLKYKGVTFSIMSEEEAISYLSSNNNFFKLSSYRKNYDKALKGACEGKYLNLEFAYLIELARIDVEVRHILLKMCLDIEHFLKVFLINYIESRVKSNTGEDGYRIISDYLSDSMRQSIVDRANNIKKRSFKIASKLSSNVYNPYCGSLILKYRDDMPIWAFVEIISFGDLLDIIDFCVENYSMKLPIDRACLDRVRQIRNATAHNNCIINDLRSYIDGPKTPRFISTFVSDAGVGKNMRQKKLSNPRINQIIHLFYAYDIIVKSENTRSCRVLELKNLLEKRMLMHADYFSNNHMLTSTYEFFKKIVNAF